MAHLISTSEQLGQLIQQTRKQSNIRQEDFALLLGVSHVSIRNLEHGKSGVNIGLLFRALNELGINLIADTPNRSTPESR